MAKYKIKDSVIGVNLLNGNWIEDKEVRDGSEFENVDELVEKGFLELVSKKEEPKKEDLKK